MNKEDYKFQNVYIITGYGCNCKCDFCLFRFNDPSFNNKKIIESIKYILTISERNDLYFKITGGEPFLNNKLLEEIIDLSGDEKIYKIGIGTNGTIPIPSFLNKTQKKIEIYFSRHHYENKINNTNFKNDSDLDLYHITKNITNPKIRFHLNCNLIKNGIDSLDKIFTYINWAIDHTNVSSITFRELNNISLNKNYNYDNFVYSYRNYYKNNKIDIDILKNKFIDSGYFRLTLCNGNYYDTNYRFYYDNLGKKISIKLRRVDEQKLVEYNEIYSGLDEWTIFPKGEISMSWDKKKIIKK